MKIYTRIPHKLDSYYKIELSKYRKALESNDFVVAYRHLERAHILGQSYPVQHTYIHWLMLKFGVRIKDFREVTGQIPRLLLGGVKSFIGRIPVGNTGGAYVPILKPMEIPDDLKAILKSVSYK